MSEDRDGAQVADGLSDVMGGSALALMSVAILTLAVLLIILLLLRVKSQEAASSSQQAQELSGQIEEQERSLGDLQRQLSEARGRARDSGELEARIRAQQGRLQELEEALAQERAKPPPEVKPKTLEEAEAWLAESFREIEASRRRVRDLESQLEAMRERAQAAEARRGGGVVGERAGLELFENDNGQIAYLAEGRDNEQDCHQPIEWVCRPRNSSDPQAFSCGGGGGGYSSGGIVPTR